MTLLLACLLAFAAQSQADPMSAVSGVAVDGSTGRPLPGALIYLVGERGGARVIHTRQITDPKGRFVFANLPVVDHFTLTGSKSGYLDGFNGPESAPAGTATPIRVAAGEWYPSARVALYPPGAIGGRVVDESAEPVVGADVRLLSRVKIQGRSELAAGPTARTDDRGAFKFPGLPPGQYVVFVPSVQTTVPASIVRDKSRSGHDAAGLEIGGARLLVDRYLTPPPPVRGKWLAYPVTFYPGTTSTAEAASIALGYGQSRTDIDIRLSPVTTFHVSGVVSGPKDALVNLTLRLLPAGFENLGFGSETATALVDGDGRFTFLGVPEGSYLLDGPRSATELNMRGTGGPEAPAQPQPPGYNGWSLNSEELPMSPGVEVSTRTYRSQRSANYWVRMPLAVSADLDNVVVTMQPMGVLSGRVRFERDPAKSDPRPGFYTMSLDPASGSPGLGLPRAGVTAAADDEFTIVGLAPATYFLRFSGPPGWMIKSITASGRDYTFSPLDALAAATLQDVDVVVTNATPILSGIVTAGDSGLTPGATVLVFPADRGRWFNYGLKPTEFKALLAGNDGFYRTGSLPAGEYFVLSLAGPPGDWLRPEFLEIAARRASRVSLSWGQSSTVDLRVVEIRR